MDILFFAKISHPNAALQNLFFQKYIFLFGYKLLNKIIFKQFLRNFMGFAAKRGETAAKIPEKTTFPINQNISSQNRLELFRKYYN